MTSLTVDIGLKALNTILNRKPYVSSSTSTSTELGHSVKFFHRVLFRHNLAKASSSNFANGIKYSEANTQKCDKPPFLYICLCEQDLVLVDPYCRYLPYKPNFGPGTDKPIPVQYQDSTGGINPHIIFAIPYLYIGEVIADSSREDIFGIGLEYEADTVLPYETPLAMRFSYTFRKNLVEDLQICHNVYSILLLHKANQFPVRFLPLDRTIAKRIQLDNSYGDKRLAAFQYFSNRRLPPELLNHRIFYRNEYMFLGSQEMSDKYEALPNRPCSTYIIDSEETRQAILRGKKVQRPRMLLKILPARSMSDMTPLLHGRDARSINVVSEDEDVIDLELSHAGQSDLEFFFWVESIAHAIAMNESETPDQFFIPEKGVYNRKMNIVNDKCQWTCFKVHIFTKYRQIGIIGCRREFLPPYLDSYQDFVFVLYGPKQPVIRPQRNFMETLELAVDTLSPAAAPLPFREANVIDRRIIEDVDKLTTQYYETNSLLQAHSVNLDAQSITMDPKIASTYNKLKTLTVHRTYVDRDLVQARANTLFYTTKQLRWLASRDWLTDPSSSITGLIPHTKFIDVECYSLAMKFSMSVLLKVSGSTTNIANIKEEYRPVSDPLAIIFRMMAELDQDYDHTSTGNSMSTPSTLNRLLGSDNSKTENTNVNIVEEWRARIAQYFAYCVDGGVLPDELTFEKLTKSDVADVKSIEEVLDFLLYMRKKPKSLKKTLRSVTPYVQCSSIAERIATTDILAGFTCNEDVLLRLVQLGYFDISAQRYNQPDLVSRLYKCILLTKHYNLKLIRAVCNRICTARIVSDQALVEPLINLAKVANFYIKADAFNALAALASYGHDLMVFEKGGVGMALYNLYTSRSSEIIEGALRVLLAVSNPQKLGLQPYAILTQPDLARKLIHLLSPFEKTTPDQERHHPTILELTANLITKLAGDRSVLLVLVENLAHVHLSHIVEYTTRYHHILTYITSAIGTIYLHAGSLITRPRYTNRTQQERIAVFLVDTLRTHCTSSKIQLCLNMLIVLRMMVDFWLVPIGVGEKAYKKYWPSVQDRVDLLVKLKKSCSFDMVLDRCKQMAEEVSNLAITNKTILENSADYPDLNDKEKALRRLEYDNQIKLANGILAKYNWFLACSRYCNQRENTTKNFQHDGKQLQPLNMNDK